MVWRSLADIAFGEAKQLLVGCREQRGKKIQSSNQKYRTPSKLQNEIKKNIVLSWRVKKCFFLRKLTKISNLILCFSKIPKIFIFCPREAGDFLI